MSPTSEFLEVTATFYKRGQSLLNLLLRLMKVSYYGQTCPDQVGHIRSMGQTYLASQDCSLC
jgi:hypothetical protein